MNKSAVLMVSMEDTDAAPAHAVPHGKLMWAAPIARRTS